MTSERKLEANRANAQLSTGPQSPEGKAASAQNARRHGLTAHQLFIPPDRQDDFQSLLNNLHHQIQPQGEIELQYFNQLLHAAWNLTIARELHASALSLLDEPRIDRAARYIAQFERSFARAHKALREAQTNRAIATLPSNEPLAQLPQPCQIKTIGNEATKLTRHQPDTRHQVLAALASAFSPAPTGTHFRA